MKSEVDTLPTNKKKRTSKLSIISFVIGVPNLIVLFVLTMLGRLHLTSDKRVTNFIPFIIISIAALVSGMIAVNKIEKSDKLKGISLTIVGMLAACFILVPLLLLLLLFTAIRIHAIPVD